jgi:hypothetical protein
MFKLAGAGINRIGFRKTLSRRSVNIPANLTVSTMKEPGVVENQFGFSR